MSRALAPDFGAAPRQTLVTPTGEEITIMVLHVWDFPWIPASWSALSNLVISLCSAGPFAPRNYDEEFLWRVLVYEGHRKLRRSVWSARVHETYKWHAEATKRAGDLRVQYIDGEIAL